jgi:5-methylcytosine-specific restriction endonuclease McrA
MPNRVFVLDTDHVPQTPVHPAVARKMLTEKRAAVLTRVPFTIILKTRGPGPLFVRQHRLKIDPGSKTTGLALLDGGKVVWAAELTHRGQRIKEALEKRRVVRRGRRQRTTRYRPARFDNRRRPKGWLPPSLQSRVDNVLSWVGKLARRCALTALSQELVRFDTQLMQNPEITGVEYQQGALAGYEVREYLLEKWQRTCAYCGAKDVRLEVEHITPKSRGGSNRVSNLTLACVPCNTMKGTQTAAEFGHPQVQAQAKKPLKDAAAVNATRWALSRALQHTGLPVETGTGGRTKYNRTRLHIAKSHWGDAACVGASTPATLALLTTTPLLITAVGRGRRQVVRTDAHGFPRGGPGRIKRSHGLSTGDIVRLVQPRGKYAGTHTGRLAGIRARGDHDLKTTEGKTIKGKAANMTLLQRGDGYAYA